MLKVGLTGGIGSGKSTVANLFRQHGAPIIDADEIAHTLTKPNTECYTKIMQHFGKQFIRADGSINRDLLREIIFADKAKRIWLEQLLHPKIIHEITDKMLSLKTPYCIAVVPLLVESKLDKLFDRILVVDANEQDQLSRALTRDHTDKNTVEEIIHTQASREERLKLATDVITNDSDLKNLEQQVTKLHKKYSQQQAS